MHMPEIGPVDAILSWFSKTCGTNSEPIAYDHHVHITGRQEVLNGQSLQRQPS